MRQRVYVAFDRIGAAHLIGQIGLIDMTALDEVDVDRGNDVGMLRRRDLAVVRQGAGFPQQRHAFLALGEIADLRLLRETSSACWSTAGSARVSPSTGALVSMERFSPSRLE